MKRTLAAIASVALALSMAVLPAISATAAPPQGDPQPCNTLGYTKFDSGSGNQDLYSGSALVGNLTWSGPNLTYTLQPGWSVDLCIKSGAQVGTVEYPSVSGSGTLTIAQDISHIGWKNPVRGNLTPGYSSTNEQCVDGQLVSGTVSVVVTQGVAYALTGPQGAVALNGGSSGPIPAGEYTLTGSDSDPNDGFTVTALATGVTIAAFEGQCGYEPQPVVVTPGVSSTSEKCVDGKLVGGTITVDLSVPGVVYEIDEGAVAFDPTTGTTGPLAPGQYVVKATDADANDAYVLAEVFEVVVEVESHYGTCGGYEPEPTVVTPAVESLDQSCDAGDLVGGTITVDLSVPGVTYEIDGGTVPFDGSGTTGPLAPGQYVVSATDSDANDDYVLEEPFEQVVEILAYYGQCGYEPEVVTPKVDSTDQICEAGELVGGHITVDLTVPGVTYEIDGGAVPFDGTGTTAELPPGQYLVTATDSDPNDAYELSGPFEQVVEILGSDDPNCVDLPDHPLVTPFASSLAGSCTVNGSYTLGNSEGDGAVTWAANGQSVAEGTHVVTGSASVTVVATAVGPDFGFGEGTQTEWTFQFTAPTGCGDLDTLALTGTEGVSFLAAAGALTLAGGILLLSASRLRRVRSID
jgi:hypothetical protein